MTMLSARTAGELQLVDADLTPALERLEQAGEARGTEVLNDQRRALELPRRLLRGQHRSVAVDVGDDDHEP